MGKTTEFALPLTMRDCSGGMMSGVDDAFIPDNCSRLSLGFRYDKIGCATQRYGYTRVGLAVSVGNNNDGIHGFIDSNGNANRVIATYNGTHYAYNHTAWGSIGSGATPGVRTRFASFINYVFKVGGGQASQSWDGNMLNSFGTTKLTGAPSGNLVIAYKSKLYIAGNSTNPDRLYWSSIPSITNTLTWDTSTQYLDVNPADGDNLTALAKTGTQMLLLKRNFIYRWNGTATDPEPVINVGTISQETVANVNGTVVFFHPTGVYMTDGGIPVKVSRPVQNFIKAIPASAYPELCSYADGNVFGLFIPSLTVDDRTFTNLVMEFDIETQAWQCHELGHTFRAFAQAKTASKETMLVGGMGTYVQQMFTGTTDDGLPIKFERETKRMEFDGLYSKKAITDVVYYLQGATGAVFSAIPIGADGLRKKPVQFDASKGMVTYSSGKNAEGHAISFKISGTNTGAPAVWRGFDILVGRTFGASKPN